MDEDTFNMPVRTFLKKVGVNAQREIETAVREAVNSGKLKGNETLPARMTLTVEAAGVETVIEGDISLV